MNIERQVQQRSMFGGVPTAPSGACDGMISGIAPGCSSGVRRSPAAENWVSALASV